MQMKTLIIAVAASIVALMAFPPMIYAGEYYVIRNGWGDMAITNGVPLNEWTVQSGPYVSVDAAERATGTGEGSDGRYNYHRFFVYPEVAPRRAGQIPFVHLTP